MYDNENNNMENGNFENGNAENQNFDNNVENSNSEISENGNYRMTQDDIINNGITSVEQNNDTINNNDITNDNANINMNTQNNINNNNNYNDTLNNYPDNINNMSNNNNYNGNYNNMTGSPNYNNGYGNNINYNGNMGYSNNNYSGNNNYSNRNNYSGYNPYNSPNNNINNNNNMNNKPNDMNNSFNSKKAKKKSGIGKKIAAVALSAVMFGAIAGGTMYGVYYTANEIKPVSSNSSIQLPLVSSGTSLEDSDNFDNIKISSSDELNVKKVANAAMPAMVALSGTTQVSGSSSFFGGGFGQSYQAQTSGTGIIVGKNDTELLVLTNAHVVEDVNNLTCTFVDNENVECTVKGSKSNEDVAVVTVPLSSIKSSTLNQIAIAELGDSDSVVLGQEVVAIGNALGKGQSVTSGIISALNRSITVDNVTFDNLIMTDAAINSGNSGGALLDASGKVIGINFAKTSADGVQGMAYAIPISNVRDLIDSLMNRQTRTKVSESEMGYLGVNLLDVTSSVAELYGYPQGVMIRSVEEGSAADRAGLGVYDILVSFDDQTVTSSSSLLSMLQYYEAGETVKVEYYHIEGNEYVLKSVDITLDKRQ